MVWALELGVGEFEFPSHGSETWTSYFPLSAAKIIIIPAP